jgi:peptidyl-prolyl cis-trans isomerase D
MLRFLRHKGKRAQTIWWVLIIITVVTFLGGFVFILGSGFDSSSRARAAGAVGVVEGMEVSRIEFQNAVAEARENFVRQYGAEPGERDLKMIEVQAWRTITLQKLMDREARKLGISAGDPEVVMALKTNPPQSILNSPAFQTDGKFDVNKYQQVMMDRNNVAQVAAIEAMTREQLPTRKLQERLISSVKLSEPEIQAAYRDRFERLNATIAMIPGSDAKVATPTDADLQRVYEKYKSRFSLGARTQVEALVVPKQFGDEEIRSARQLAQSLVDRARRGEDFASLARDYSEGPGAESGGVIDRVFQLTDFGQDYAPKIAALDTGQVTDPMQDGGRFLVLKLLSREATPQGTPGVRVAQIVVRIRPNPEQLRSQYESLVKLRNQAARGGLGKAAAEKGMPTVMTPFFDASNTPPQLFGAPEAADWALGAKKGAVSPVFEALDEFAIVQITAQVPAGIAPKEEITAQLRSLAEMDTKVEAAKAKADQMGASVKAGASLEQAAAAAGIETRRVDGVTRLQPDPSIASAPELVGALFGAQPGQVIGPIRAVNGWYFARVEEKFAADPALFQQVRSQLTQDLLQRRQQSFMTTYLMELRGKAKIKDLRGESAF